LIDCVVLHLYIYMTLLAVHCNQFDRTKRSLIGSQQR